MKTNTKREKIRSRQPISSDYTPKTDLGKKLWALRQKYIAGGGKLLSLQQVQQEIARRRGELD